MKSTNNTFNSTYNNLIQVTLFLTVNSYAQSFHTLVGVSNNRPGGG